jgi:hypothetical protein
MRGGFTGGLMTFCVVVVVDRYTSVFVMFWFSVVRVLVC